MVRSLVFSTETLAEFKAFQQAEFLDYDMFYHFLNKIEESVGSDEME
jgi:hypothetical protein